MKTGKLIFWYLIVLLTFIVACSARATVSPTVTPLPAIPTIPPTLLPSPTVVPPRPSPTLPLPSPTSLPPAATIPPTLPAPSNTYAVILVPDNSALSVHQLAGADSAVLENLSSQAAEITLTGRDAMVGEDRWVEIDRPAGGTGWVKAYFLTEYVPPTVFCSDERVNELLRNFATAITTRDGKLLASLVSPVHGWSVQLFRTGNVANYSSEEARWVFESTYQMNWGVHPASGIEEKGPFHEKVLPMMDIVFGKTTEATCNQVTYGSNYMLAWPSQYANINYYSLAYPGTPGTELDWRNWLTGVEYVDGQPYFFASIQLFWEP